MADPRVAGEKPDSPHGRLCFPRRFDSPTAIEATLSRLISTGWIEESAGLLRLTLEGEQQHADLAPLVDDVRGRVARALPQEDYVTLIRLLERLAAAL